jgi:hypothetical protein
MVRSFQLVEDKLEEAIFFLEKLGDIKFNFFEARCYFNAYVSAARSVTFALQASLNGVDGFDDWYGNEQATLKRNRLARFFVECRNDSQKVGLNQIVGGAGSKDKHYLFFGETEVGRHKWIPDENVVTCCRRHISLLCEMLQRCTIEFGPIIDPNQFYTLENLEAIGWSIEDVEQELGLPIGFTNLEGRDVSHQDRLSALRKHIPMSSISSTLDRYILTE